MPRKRIVVWDPNGWEARREKLKNAVRFFYDLQQLRIQASNRAAKKAAQAEAHLDEDDKHFLESTGVGLKQLEKGALKEVARLLAGIPIYEKWLNDQRGIGPTLSGLLISEFNIEHCQTPSQMWAWAGLAVRDGKADRRIKGQRARFNPWLKSKITEVMAGSLLKSASPYRALYDAYKHRKQHQQVEVCMGCEGTGEQIIREKTTPPPGEKKKRKKRKCENCGGTGGPAPWGVSDAHRHRAALRYMAKQFLADYWREWRTMEALPTRPPYCEEYLGRIHHTLDHATRYLTESEPQTEGDPKCTSVSPQNKNAPRRSRAPTTTGEPKRRKAG